MFPKVLINIKHFNELRNDLFNHWDMWQNFSLSLFFPTYTTEYFCCHFLIKLAKDNSNIISLQGKKEEILIIDIFIRITQKLLYIAKSSTHFQSTNFHATCTLEGVNIAVNYCYETIKFIYNVFNYLWGAVVINTD